MRYLIAIYILWTVSMLAKAEDLGPDTYVAEGAVMLFWNACVKFYPDRTAFDSWVNGNSFDVVPEDMVAGLVREPGGKAYSVNNNGVRYLLVVQAKDLCSVFVREVNLDLAAKAFRKWHEALETKGWVKFDEVRIADASRGALRTTEYTYTLAGNEVMSVVVSEAHTNADFFQLAMSASIAQGANHPLQTQRPGVKR